LNSKLHELKDKGYTDQIFFEIALKNKIDELADKYQTLIEKYAVKKSTYQLTELSLSKLQSELEQQETPDIINKESITAKAQQQTFALTQQSIELLKKDIPNPIVNDLRKMQNTEYPDEDKYIAAVGTIIKKNMTQQFHKYYLPSVLKYAKVEGPYRISEAYLEKLRQKQVPDYVIARLSSLPKEPYPDINAFKKAVRPIIEDVTIGDNFPDPTIPGLVDLRAEAPENQRKKANVIIQEERKKYKNYTTIILDEIEKLPLFILTEQSFETLKNGGVPNDLNSKLHELKDKGYTDQIFFEIALKNKIDELAVQYQALIVKYAVKKSY